MDQRRTVYVVPHTHWDREWYEPFQRFRMRLVELLDHVLREAEADERFCFTLDGQTATVEDYLEVRPDAEERVRRLVARGQLAVGPWRILSDEFLSSGETLVRNLERGWARAEELGGAMAAGYLPDEFGHVAQMPQILRRAGIPVACVWRGVPGVVDWHVFDWSAPDGSTVRCEYLPLSYGHAARLFDDRQRLDAAVAGVVASLEPYVGDGDVLAMCGTDHTWPVSRMASIASEYDDGTTTLQIATLAAYLERSARRDDAPGGRPSWQGELRAYGRANLLPGVTSSRIAVKAAMARAERLLERYAEPLSALWLPAERWPQPFLDLAWERVIASSGHDSVTGCGHDEVAAQVVQRLVEARQIATGLVDRVLDHLAGMAGGEVFVNPSPATRTEVVVRADGSCVVATVPPLGWSSRADATSEAPPFPPVEGGATRRAYHNGLVSFTVADDGTLSIERDGVALRGVGRLVDGGDVGDLYNYAPPSRDLLVDRPDDVRIEVTDHDHHRVRLSVVRTYTWPAAAHADRVGRTREDDRPVTVTTVVELRAGEPFVRLSVELENRCRDHRLRLHVPLDRTPESSYAEGQFAVVRRGLEAPDASGIGGRLAGRAGGPAIGEEPIPTYPARSFVVAAGAAVLLPHVTEYEVVQDELALTVLRCVGVVSNPDNPLRRDNAGPALPTPGAQCIGDASFSCAVMPIAGEWYDAGVVPAAERYAHPIMCAGDGSDAGSGQGRGLDVAGAELTALRRRGDWVELRLVRLDPRAGDVVVRGDFREARRADLLGRRGADLGPVEDGRLTLRVAAWEIATLQVR